ncbi:thioredoxin domain protein [Thiovulum sp. ES]|nr:thioredoxin domain protein [Thiovulum sp. ES]
MANKLELEDSPYLQQHKNNPVDWYPWGEEAIQKAIDEDKMIFLSIGYSSCHWCHVMEKESFENEKIADLLNGSFVSIKLDREERPDLDKYYQDLYASVYKKGGGWPLSVFLTPEKKPFHIDTYIPEVRKYNKVGMEELLPAMIEEWISRKEKILEAGNQIHQFAEQKTQNIPREIENGMTEHFVKIVEQNFDSNFGGFSKPPKFPQVGILKTLLLLDSTEMVEKTLLEMTKGGFYDLIDGGFCRYSVDERWLVPHFEKMTYDNGLLLELLSDLYLKTENPLFKRFATETANFLLSKMEKENLFYSASDADSDGEEGKYFTYKHHEVVEKIDYHTLQNLSITPYGNFEENSIVRVENHKELPKEFQILRKMRETRNYPNIDNKIITSWNAMAVKGFFRLSKIDKLYKPIAELSLQTLLETMSVENTLFHSTISGKKPKISGFLEDYAYLSDVLVEAYQQTYNSFYLEKLEQILDLAIEKFHRENRWYSSEKESDVEVEAESEDSSYPSSRAKIVSSLISGSALLDRRDFWQIAEDTISHSISNFWRYTTAYGSLTEAIWKHDGEVLVVKSTEENLDKLDFNSPKILKKVSQEKSFEICGIGLCYNKVVTVDEVKDFIKGFWA